MIKNAKNGQYKVADFLEQQSILHMNLRERKCPKNMDKYSRNQRLYVFLLNMGLIATPVFKKNSSDKIEYIHVTAGKFDDRER